MIELFLRRTLVQHNIIEQLRTVKILLLHSSFIPRINYT